VDRQEAKQKFKQADAYYRSKEYAKALNILEELDGAFPATRNILYPKIQCLAALGRMEEALQDCNSLEVLCQDPRADKLRARLLTTMPQADTDRFADVTHAAPKAPRKSRHLRIPVIPAVAAMFVILLVAGLPFAARLRSGTASGKGDSPKNGQAPPSQASAAQESIDRAIRSHIKTSVTDPFARVFDTGTFAPEPYSGHTLALREGWTEIPEEQTEHTFQGDAVIANNEIALVLRKGAPGPELYAQNIDSPKMHAVLVPGTAGPSPALDTVSIRQNSPDQAVVHASFNTPDAEPVQISCSLTMGQVFVQVQPIQGLTHLRIRSGQPFRHSSRFLRR